MNPDREIPQESLRPLLRDADAAFPPPPLDPDLAANVRRLSRRRRSRRRIAGGCVVVLVAASVVAAVQSSRGRLRGGSVAQSGPLSHSPATPPAPHVSVPVSNAVEAAAEYRLAKLEADAAVASASRLLVAERSRRQLRELDGRLADGSPTQAERIASFRAVAALTLISQADRLESRADSPLDALATYRRAVELFPDTPWVAVARQRMEELQSRMRNQEIPS